MTTPRQTLDISDEGRIMAFIVMYPMVRSQMADPAQSKYATYAKAFLKSERGRWSKEPVRYAADLGIDEYAIRDFYIPSDWDRVCDAIDTQAQMETGLIEAKAEIRRAKAKREQEDAEDRAAAGDGPLRRAFFESKQYMRRCFPNEVSGGSRKRGRTISRCER